MTCVVAYIDSNGVGHMAADSAGTAVGAHSRSYNKDAKIFKRESMLIGYTSSFRMGQIIEHCLELPEHPEGLSDYEYLIRVFVPVLQKTFVDTNYMQASEKEGGRFLIVWNGEIYHIQEDFAVFRRDDKFDAVGSGASLAIGALDTMENYNLIDQVGVMDALVNSIATVGKYNITVAGRIDYIRTDEDFMYSTSEE